MTNETTASERERFEREAFGRVYDEVANRRETTIRQIAWHCWKAARAALPTPADQGSAEAELEKIEAWLIANPEAWPCIAGSPADVAIAVMASRRKDHP